MGRCHGNQILAKISQKNHKNGHNFSFKPQICADFCFEIGFVQSWNSSVTLRTQGTKGDYHGNQFWDKIAITAHKCISTRDNENAITYNRRFLWSTNPKKTFLVARVYGTLPWQPNFGQNRPKNHKNGHNFSFKPHIHAEFCFEVGFVTSGNSSVTLPYTRDKWALPWRPILGQKLL